jgi:hypothetical protein
LISLEIQGIFIPPDQQTSSFSNKKMGGMSRKGHVNAMPDAVTLDGNGRKWKVVAP